MINFSEYVNLPIVKAPKSGKTWQTKLAAPALGLEFTVEVDTGAEAIGISVAIATKLVREQEKQFKELG